MARGRGKRAKNSDQWRDGPPLDRHADASRHLRGFARQSSSPDARRTPRRDRTRSPVRDAASHSTAGRRSRSPPLRAARTPAAGSSSLRASQTAQLRNAERSLPPEHRVASNSRVPTQGPSAAAPHHPHSSGQHSSQASATRSLPSQADEFQRSRQSHRFDSYIEHSHLKSANSGSQSRRYKDARPSHVSQLPHSTESHAAISDCHDRPAKRSGDSLRPGDSRKRRRRSRSVSPQRSQAAQAQGTSASPRDHRPHNTSSETPSLQQLRKKDKKRRARARKRERDRAADAPPSGAQSPAMSYPYDGPYAGRGGPPRPRENVGSQSQYGHGSPSYPASHSASPYSASGHPGWGSDPYAGQHRSGLHPPVQPGPYDQLTRLSSSYGYPPQGSYQYSHGGPPSGYPSGPPPPSPYSGGNPPYPPQGYSSHPGYAPPYDRRGSYEGRPPPDRRGRGGYPPPPDRRAPSISSQESWDSRGTTDASRGARRGRGHFTNLSWTPKEGRRGGHHVPSKRERDDDDDDRSSDKDERDSRDRTPEAREREHEVRDDLFRPPQDFRSEDRASQDSKAMPPPVSTPKPVLESDARTGSTPNRPSAAPGPTPPKKPPSSAESGRSKPQSVQSIQEKLNRVLAQKGMGGKASDKAQPPEPPRKQLVKVKKYKRAVAPEHEDSDSVYHRKPGNESVIGSGTYGKVYRAVHVYTGDQVALKKVRMEGERDGFPITAMREIKIVQKLRHEHIVRLHEIMVEKNDCYMVFEYLSHDLTGLLNHPTFRLTPGHKKNLAHQLMSAIEYMHSKSILHRDLKAANILISNKGLLKLADFGLARQYDKRRKVDYTNRVITIWYRSPELLLGETQYGPAVDIWSAACVFVEIFTRHSLFPGEGGEIAQLEKIHSIMGTPTKTEWPDMVELPWYELLRPASRVPSTFTQKYADKVSPDAFALLQQMLSYDPKNRPTAEEILSHAYFTEEEPPLQPLTELESVQGEWHEFESKKLRKEGEERRRQEEKRKRQHDAEEAAAAEREAKRVKLDDEAAATASVTAALTGSAPPAPVVEPASASESAPPPDSASVAVPPSTDVDKEAGPSAAPPPPPPLAG